MKKNFIKSAVILAAVAFVSFPLHVNALQNDLNKQISHGTVLRVSPNQIVIRGDQLSRATTMTSTSEKRIENAVNPNDPNYNPSNPHDPNANLKDTTGNPHDTLIGKEIVDKHNETGISDGDVSAKPETYATTRTTTTTTTTSQGRDNRASAEETYQITANTKLNNLNSMSEISANDNVEISFTRENGKNIANSITKKSASENM